MAQDGQHDPPVSDQAKPRDSEHAAEAEMPADVLGSQAETTDSDAISVGDEPAEASGSSSAISLGTGQSGIALEDWSIAGELGDQEGLDDEDLASEEFEPPSAGTFELPEGLVPDLEHEFAAADATDGEAAGGDEADELGSEFSEFAEIDNPEMAADLIGETSQDELPGSWADGDEVDVATVGTEEAYREQVASRDPGRAAARVGLRPRPLPRRTTGSSLVGVIIGGLMAVPIVVAILLLGFRRDDFGIAGLMPDALAFLLPAELRLPRLPRDLPAADKMPRLPRDGFAEISPRGESGSVAVATPPALADGPVGRGDPTGIDRPVEDALLDAADLALLEMATARSNVMLSSLLELPAEAPEEMLKAARVDWYKSLAAVGEEAVAAEQVRVEGGRSAEAVARPVVALLEKIALDAVAAEELATLARQWIQATKRDSQGVVFPGQLRDVRQIGSAWAASVQAGGDDEQAREVTVLSRRRPEFADGSQVVAVGVIVAGDVIWAAVWGDLEQRPTDVLSDPPLTVE